MLNKNWQVVGDYAFESPEVIPTESAAFRFGSFSSARKSQMQAKTIFCSADCSLTVKFPSFLWIDDTGDAKTRADSLHLCSKIIGRNPHKRGL
jgi:benzoyl-CoA reductase/2-hydroxyglutaryl-CoA dehydratase subunit BcrC/BadD/HgdB